MRTRSELKLIEQAIRNDWQISGEAIRDALLFVRDVLKDEGSTDRERARASRVASLMSKWKQLVDIDAALLAEVIQLAERKLEGLYREC